MICWYPLASSAQSATQGSATTVPFFFEKVYLHSDRDQYSAGEDIWFKAYLVNAQTNQLIGFSKTLYVELINPKSEIIFKSIIRLEKGLGHGDIKLEPAMPSGSYRLRAYTNWMRNFGDNFLYEKQLTIINLPQKGGPDKRVSSAGGLIKRSPGDALASDSIHVQFLPEGGHLVNEAKTMVAFKAESKQGLGIAILGELFSGSQKILEFNCDSTGMGTFAFKPEAGKSYQAVITSGNKKTLFPIPSAISRGFTINVVNTPASIAIKVYTNALTLSQPPKRPIMLLIKSKGKSCYKQMVEITSAVTPVNLNPDLLPQGISCISLLDSEMTPLSERLIFVQHAGQTAESITAFTDKAVYLPREQVSVKIKTSKPEVAYLSLSAINTDLVSLPKENIVAYLELISEIKGKILNPQSYFDPKNANRFHLLDLLLLIQGWRDFVWKKLENRLPPIRYEIEQGITLTGKVRKSWRNVPLPNIQVTMFAPKAQNEKLFSASTDSAGRFVISGVRFYGYQYLNFTARTIKGKGGNWIQVDSLLSIPAPVASQAEPDTLVPESKIAPLIKREEEKQKFTLTGVNQLKEAKVKGYTSALPPEIHPITSKEQKEYTNLGHYLLGLIPGAHIEYELCEMKPYMVYGYIINKGVVRSPVLYISAKYSDGSLTDLGFCDDPLSIGMERILKVTVRARETVYGRTYSVELLLRPGTLEVRNYFDQTVADINGYYRSRVFYAPQHQTTDYITDLRTTLHWQPEIITDDKGEATVTFYNGDSKDNVAIVIQGVSEIGTCFYALLKYTIK